MRDSDTHSSSLLIAALTLQAAFYRSLVLSTCVRAARSCRTAAMRACVSIRLCAYLYTRVINDDKIEQREKAETVREREMLRTEQETKNPESIR